MDATSGAAASVGTTTTVATRDHVYCLELAKRSVARAALHLGVPSMTHDVLDVLGDVMCDYLERLAAVLAQGVESSGRSTQHVNALDMLQAVELCTSPAVSRVHFTTENSSASGTSTTAAATGSSSGATANSNTNSNTNTADAADSNDNMDIDNNNNNNGANNNDGGSNDPNPDNNNDNNNTAQQQHHTPGSWQGLAAFCFGPNWQDQNALSKELEVAELQGAGGKVGPRAISQQEESAKDVQEGWRAPFPDEVVPFPAVLSSSGGGDGDGGGVSNPHAMTHQQVLVALYGTPEIPTSSSSLTVDTTSRQTNNNPLMDIVRGKNLISAAAAEQERKNRDTALGQMPESVWGGLTPTNAGSSAAAAEASKNTATRTTGSSANKEEKEASAGAKRKLEETDASGTSGGGGTAKDDGAKSDDAAASSAAAKKDATETDDTQDKDNRDGNKPAKKKVKLEDGTAKTTKAATPRKKKASDKRAAAASDMDTDDVDMKDAADDSQQQDDDNKAAAAASSSPGTAKSGTAATASGKTYNYVPTFYPPIPAMSSGQVTAHLLQKTVVELLDHPSASTNDKTPAAAPSDVTSSSKNANSNKNSNNITTTFGLRSALVQLGTSYWGSAADAPESAPAGGGSNVPAGRSIAAQAAQATPLPGPIVPLGKASGSRVSRILEGSMDAAAMQ